MKKTAGFYLPVLGAILTAVGIYFYQQAEVVDGNIPVICGVAIGLAVLGLILGLAKVKLANFCPTVIALVLMYGLAGSFGAQLDPLGWWVAGLYTFDQVKGFIIFAVLVAIALLLTIIASFMDANKKVD